MIYIEANSGAAKRVGRCDAYATEFDLEAEEYVPLPKVRAAFLFCVVVGIWTGGWRIEGVFSVRARGPPRSRRTFRRVLGGAVFVMRAVSG